MGEELDELSPLLGEVVSLLPLNYAVLRKEVKAKQHLLRFDAKTTLISKVSLLL